MGEEQPLSVAKALDEWRSAERGLATATKGREAAAAAAKAAEIAERAATQTSEAAHAAFEAATLADSSARATADAARVALAAASGDLTESVDNLAIASAGEAAAHQRFREAEDRARQEVDDRDPG